VNHRIESGRARPVVQRDAAAERLHDLAADGQAQAGAAGQVAGGEGCEQALPQVRDALKPASTLWITFPKGTSKIQTDLTRDQGWDSLRSLDLKWINLISVDDTWSAFALRPYKSGEERQSFR